MKNSQEVKRPKFMTNGKDTIDVFRIFSIFIFIGILVLSFLMLGKFNNVYGFSALVAFAFIVLFIGWGMATVIDFLRDIRRLLIKMNAE